MGLLGSCLLIRDEINKPRGGWEGLFLVFIVQFIFLPPLGFLLPVSLQYFEMEITLGAYEDGLILIALL